MEKRCVVDGVVFEAQRVSALYCSDRCKKRAQRRGMVGQNPPMRSDSDDFSRSNPPLRSVPPPEDVPPSADVLAVRQRIVSMRITGASYATIARQTGLTAEEAADEAEQALAALERLTAAESQHSTALDLARLDGLEQQAYAVLRFAQGNPDAKIPMDSMAMLGAIDKLLKIQSSRSVLKAADPVPARPKVDERDRARLFALAHGRDPDDAG